MPTGSAANLSLSRSRRREYYTHGIQENTNENRIRHISAGDATKWERDGDFAGAEPVPFPFADPCDLIPAPIE